MCHSHILFSLYPSHLTTQNLFKFSYRPHIPFNSVSNIPIEDHLPTLRRHKGVIITAIAPIICANKLLDKPKLCTISEIIVEWKKLPREMAMGNSRFARKTATHTHKLLKRNSSHRFQYSQNFSPTKNVGITLERAVVVEKG